LQAKARVFDHTEHSIDPANVDKEVVAIVRRLASHGYSAYLVGGAVRDLLLGKRPKDFDIVTDALPNRIRKIFSNSRIIGKRFKLVHVYANRKIYEVATFRSLSIGTVGNEYGTIDEDVARRDFTVNALYYDPLALEVLDFLGGMEDLRAGRLKAIIPLDRIFREDPVRMLRVVRFAAKLSFTIDAATSAPIAVMAPLINNVPAARVFDEMLKLLMSGHALACLQQLRKEGLHHGLLPLLDVVLEQPLGEKFVTLALANTDARIKQGKPVSPGFLFASLLWHQVLENGMPIRPPASIRSRRCIWRRMTCSTPRPKNWPCNARSPPTCAISGPCSHASNAASAKRPTNCWNICACAPVTISCCCVALRARLMPNSANGGLTSCKPMARDVKRCWRASRPRRSSAAAPG